MHNRTTWIAFAECIPCNLIPREAELVGCRFVHTFLCTNMLISSTLPQVAFGPYLTWVYRVSFWLWTFSVSSLWLNMNHLVKGNHFNSSFLGAWVTIILCSSPFLPRQEVFNISLNMFSEAQSQTPLKVIYSNEHPKALTTLSDWDSVWILVQSGKWK